MEAFRFTSTNEGVGKGRFFKNFRLKEYDHFKNYLATIMSWVILWRRNGEKPCLNDIPMQELFYFDNGSLKRYAKPTGYSNVSHCIHSHVGIPYPKYSGVKQILSEFNTASGKDNFIRGKYVVWFFVNFILSIHQNISVFSSTIAKPPKLHINLGTSNFAVIVAPRARIPRCLRSFLKSTCIVHSNAQ
jgi:hypothetical protein